MDVVVELRTFTMIFHSGFGSSSTMGMLERKMQLGSSPSREMYPSVLVTKAKKSGHTTAARAAKGTCTKARNGRSLAKVASPIIRRGGPRAGKTTLTIATIQIGGKARGPTQQGVSLRKAIKAKTQKRRAKAKAKTAAKPAEKTVAKPVAKTVAKPAVKTVVKPVAKTVVKTAAKAAAKERAKAKENRSWEKSHFEKSLTNCWMRVTRAGFGSPTGPAVFSPLLDSCGISCCCILISSPSFLRAAGDSQSRLLVEHHQHLQKPRKRKKVKNSSG
mmetsp:Transcript_35675/g.64687  ORF Transcript_35675/g.64687 Transcript_35675/m.64687 type:complete len:274 (+) Transcript_35675:1-822(+)